MIYWGAIDPIFPAKLSIDSWNGIFNALECNSTVKIEHVEPDMSHTVLPQEISEMVKFISSK